jgi:hypothetical protein
MSDIGTFLMCFRERKIATFKRALFEEIFSRGAFIPSSGNSDIEYADGYTDVSIDDGEDISSLNFSRSWGDTFIAHLLELADRSGSGIILPSEDRHLVVTNPKLERHMPFDLMEAGFDVATTPEDYRRILDWEEPDPAAVAAQLARNAAARAKGTTRPRRFWPFRINGGFD